MTAAHGAFNIFYSIFLTEHGHSKSVIGALWTLGVLAEIVVFYYMSTLMRWFDLRTILLVCFAAAAVRFVAIGVGGDSLAVLSPGTVGAWADLRRFSCGGHRGGQTAGFYGSTRSRGQALYSSVSFGAGGLVGGLASGWAWEQFGGEVAFALSSLYALLGLWAVAARVRDDVAMPAAAVAPSLSGESREA